MSSSWFPVSTMLPSLTTAIISAFLMVESLCATITVVLPIMTRSRASCTLFSDSASKALVASSNNKIDGFLTIARDIAILCFCPPDNCIPLSPTCERNSISSREAKPSNELVEALLPEYLIHQEDC